uniref:Uncharacterized protein n=1 Tax=Steinernema glaseri TaxID=37863 RepID=A0A1I7ZSD7_9BILA
MAGSGLPAIHVDYAPPSAEVVGRWKRTERRLTVVSLPKIAVERRKRKEEEELKRRKRQEFVEFVDSLPKITAHIDTSSENHFFPPPDIPVDQEVEEFIQFATVHKEYEMARQYFYSLDTMISFRVEIRDRLKKRRDDLQEATTTLKTLYKLGEVSALFSGWIHSFCQPSRYPLGSSAARAAALAPVELLSAHGEPRPALLHSGLIRPFSSVVSLQFIVAVARRMYFSKRSFAKPCESRNLHTAHVANFIPKSSDGESVDNSVGILDMSGYAAVTRPRHHRGMWIAFSGVLSPKQKNADIKSKIG